MLLCLPSGLPAAGEDKILKMIGPADALILAGPDNRILLQKNPYTPLVPASTLKLLSALAVMDTLGRDYHFETHFYSGPNGALRVKGFGDPLLTSEIAADMALRLYNAGCAGKKDIRSLWVDDTYFVKPIRIPGVSPSREPYDAPVGAFCANFNTVNYRISQDKILSAEPQTPLLPFAEKLIRKTRGPRSGRMVLSHNNDTIALYGAHLLAHFLVASGAPGIDRVGLAPVNASTDTPLLVYRSPFALTELVAKMMTYSNNFIANQLVIAAGAEKYGAPGTLPKAVRLLATYCRDKLKLDGFTLVEGSGISRKNRFTAHGLLAIVTAFEPHHLLLRNKAGEHFKTGTLSGISSRVGYLDRPDGGRYRFVIMVNTRGKSAARIKRALSAYLRANDYP